MPIELALSAAGVVAGSIASYLAWRGIKIQQMKSMPIVNVLDFHPVTDMPGWHSLWLELHNPGRERWKLRSVKLAGGFPKGIVRQGPVRKASMCPAERMHLASEQMRHEIQEDQSIGSLVSSAQEPLHCRYFLLFPSSKPSLFSRSKIRLSVSRLHDVSRRACIEVNIMPAASSTTVSK